MEIDIDDVPWKDALTTAQPEIINGYMTVPSGPGWGVDINESVAREHPWEGHQTEYKAGFTPKELLYGLPSY